jgi:hypothetical protein
MAKKGFIENQKIIATTAKAEAGIEAEAEDASQHPNAYRSLIFR